MVQEYTWELGMGKLRCRNMHTWVLGMGKLEDKNTTSGSSRCFCPVFKCIHHYTSILPVHISNQILRCFLFCLQPVIVLL